MLDERCRVGTVVAAHPVLGRGACPLSVGDERIWRQRPLIELAVATAHRARGNRAPHRARKWIVTAGVKNDESQALHRLQHLVDTIERHGLVLYVDVALQNGINW